ncbi:uncharacterized protein [Palaemon carinicauda]|uniref:uncharacterized protein n=1 Tax=Palaemon carinicauda TaxID=392227 RepID=UPI0035B6602B
MGSLRMKVFKTYESNPGNFQMKVFSSFGKSSETHSSQESMGEFQDSSSIAPSLLHRPLSPLHTFLSVAGIGPQTFNGALGIFEVSWRSLPAILTIFNCIYITGLMTVTALCIIFAFIGEENPKEDARVESIKLIGVVIMCGYQLNAWVQVINALFASESVCRLLNTWDELGTSMGIDPTKGVHLKASMQVGFMILFIIAMLVATAVGKPTFVLYVLDAVSVDMYLIPSDWMLPGSLYRKFIHIVVVLVSLHQFAINKGTVFSFTTHCHFLKAGMMTWNAYLSQALEDIWEKGEQDGLCYLLQSRRKLIQLVRTTEKIFSPILQCYFATTVVIVCTELYLLAQRLKSKTREMDEMIILCLFTVQTTSLLIHVSLAAGSVQEQAETSRDVLIRGLPVTASEDDKFYMGELTRSVSIVSVYISGGNFYAVNRPFILTVVSVVASYFIVILQFMHSCEKDDPGEFSASANLSMGTTLFP